ncbi:MAG: hypothetical protein ABI220_00500 [Candidatus Saccharimonadales bacterium]
MDATYPIKRLPRIVTVITLLLAGVFLSLLTIHSASAQGNNFSWKNYNTVQYSGGDLGSGSLGSNNGINFSGRVTYQKKCQFTLILNLSSNGNNATSISNGDSIGSGGLPSCGANTKNGKPQFPGVLSSYANTLISIGGTRPSQSATQETAAQKAINITLHSYSGQNPPANINVELKNTDGSFAALPTTAAKDASNPSDIQYITGASLNPGKYTVCFSAIIKTCQGFTKIKFQPLSLSYGSTADGQKINVSLEVNPQVNGTDTVSVGPFNITLDDGNGHIKTIATDTKKIIGTGSGGVYTESFDQSFDNVVAGKYKVCLQGSTVCQDINKVDGTVANVSLKAGGADTSTASEAAACGTDTNGIAKNCDDAVFDCGGNALNWILCPVILGAQKAAESVDGFITDSLDVDLGSIFDGTGVAGSAQNGYYTAWNSFRVLATAILIIGGLIMVASQALGFEILDAYTIRKVLPRLLVAVIGINLSWPLMRFIVGFFDTVGFDIRSLIYSPFSHMHGSISFSTGIVGIFAGAATVFAMGLASLTLILTAAMALFVGFIILVIRQLALIVIIILAPIAIACYILPGTQKIWKMWKDNFLGLLVMFPIISAFIAAGHVFAVVSLQGVATGATGASTIAQVVGLVAYFIPYFLLPLTFRLATGAIGGLAGFVNDRNRGMFDRLKKTRGNAMARRNQEWRAGSLQGGNKIGLNAAGRRFNAGFRGHFGVGQRGRTALATDQAVQAGAALKNNPKLMTFAMQNDDGNAVLALSGGTKEGAKDAARDLFTDDQGNFDAERAKTAYKDAASIGFDQQKASAALMTLSQNKSRAVGAGRADIIRNGIDRLSNGNAEMAKAQAGTFAFNSRQGGRADLGGMDWGGNGAVERASFDGRVAALAHQYAGGGPITAEHRRNAMSDLATQDGISRTKVQDIIGGHTAGVQQAVDTSLHMLQHGDAGAKQLAATTLLELQNSLPNAPRANQIIINRGIAQAGVSYDGKNGTVASQLATTAGMDVADLTRGARIFGEEVPLGARQDQPQPPAHNPEDDNY